MSYVPGIGPLEPDLMIVGEAPGKYEHESGVPFVGPSGEILNDILRKSGTNRNSCYITNVVKYRPPLNNFKQLHLIGVDLNDSIRSLWEDEIAPRNPKCILAVGNEALKAVTNVDGILNYRGSILTARDGVIKVVPTVHPAALFTRWSGESNEDGSGEKAESSGGLEYTYLKLIEHDIGRAVEESRTRGLSLPERNLRIANNSLDTHRFFSEYKSLDKAAVDIETHNCIPICISFAFNKWDAISIPLVRGKDKNLITDMSRSELADIWRQVEKELLRIRVVGQNFKYDEFKLSRCGFKIPHVYSDVLIKTRVIFPELPRKTLGVISSIWTRQPFYKDEGKEFKLGKSPISQLLKYNAMDSAVTFEVDEEQEKDLISLQDYHKVPLVDYYYNYMMKKHKFYLKMENNGFCVDHNRQKELNSKYGSLQEGSQIRLDTLVGHEINVNSYPQVFHLLYKEMKFKLRLRNPTADDSIVALMGNHCKGKDAKLKKEILTVLLEVKRIRTQRSRYINFKPDYDGRCKCSFNIIATETCRSSTSSLKKPIRPGKFGGIPFHTISKHGRLAKDIRSMFIPDAGKVFISADSSQAEARVVAVLSEDWELLGAFDKVDIHRRTAGMIIGYTKELVLDSSIRIPVVDDMDKDDPQRFCGKKTRHAGNYDMGSNRFMLEFNTDAQKYDIPISISSWKAGDMLRLFHAASPRIRSVFHAHIIDCLEATRTIIDPFGGVRVFNGRMDEALYKEGYANIPQRTVSHLVQGAALKIEEELNSDVEHMWISENHDSLTMQVPATNWEPYARLMKKHLEKPIDFSVYCSLKRNCKLTIPADVEIAEKNYAEFTKVKLS